MAECRISLCVVDWLADMKLRIAGSPPAWNISPASRVTINSRTLGSLFTVKLAGLIILVWFIIILIILDLKISRKWLSEIDQTFISHLDALLG